MSDATLTAVIALLGVGLQRLLQVFADTPIAIAIWKIKQHCGVDAGNLPKKILPFDLDDKDVKAALHGACAIALGVLLAAIWTQLRVFARADKGVNPALDILLTGSLIAAATEGSNITIKFANYAKVAMQSLGTRSPA